MVGVFAPDSDSDTMQAFVFSEPPAHDDWIENGDRLRGKYDWGRDFIRLTKGRIRSLTRDFQMRQEDAPTIEGTDAAEFLRKTLRELFSLPGKNRVPIKPPARARAFTVELKEAGRRPNGKSLEDFVAFHIGLSEHVSVDDVSVDLRLSLAVLADDDDRPMDAHAPEVTVQDHVVRGTGEKTIVTLSLKRDDPIRGEARAEVHPAWKTRWEVAIARSES